MRTIWWDMDGTIANLYAVENWLPMLRAEDTTPYVEAGVMWNMSQLARLMNQVQMMGYKLGIISWTSKNGSDLYNGAVALSKLCWLHKHLPSVSWDKIRIVKYGTNKYIECGGGILFDDEAQNREAWQDKAFDPAEIINVLRELGE